MAAELSSLWICLDIFVGIDCPMIIRCNCQQISSNLAAIFIWLLIALLTSDRVADVMHLWRLKNYVTIYVPLAGSPSITLTVFLFFIHVISRTKMSPVRTDVYAIICHHWVKRRTHFQTSTTFCRWIPGDRCSPSQVRR